MSSAVTSADAVDYLRQNGVPDLVDEAVRALIERRHPNPAEFFLNHFQGIVTEQAAQFTKGAKVEVVGMTIDKSLNGSKGTVKGKQDEVMVQFGPPLGLRAIKTANCRPTSGCVASVGDEIQVINMSLAKEINDKKGIVKLFSTKVFVKVEGDKEEMRALPQANLKVIKEDESAALAELEKGATVEVRGMVIDTSMNGKRGEVKYRQDSVVVKVHDGGIKTLAADNCKVVGDGKLAVHSEIIIQKMCLDKAMNGQKADVKMMTSKVYVSIPELGVKAFPPAALKRVQA